MNDSDEGRDPEEGSADDPSDHELLAECRIETFRAGGPGGQHQNKTESAVRLTHEPSGIVVTARDSRSQHRNRRAALARLRERLAEEAEADAPRIPTRPTRASKKRRLDEKRRRSRKKRLREKPRPDD